MSALVPSLYGGSTTGSHRDPTVVARLPKLGAYLEDQGLVEAGAVVSLSMMNKATVTRFVNSTTLS